MQTGTVIGIPDIHAGALAHRIKTAQHLDLGVVVRVVV